MNLARAARFLASFYNDTGGILLPYVTMVMAAVLGVSMLAIDGSRYMSLQTQMQAAADGLALAGARELNQQSGAQSRAIAAMSNTSFGNGNTLFGMGTSPTFHYSYAFYKSLPAATAGLTGIATTSDSDTRFVAVTVTAVSVPTIFPVRYFNPNGTNTFSTGAQSVAGFTSEIVCDMPPVFICNPYETSGMSDSQATQALRTNFSDPAVLRKQYRLDATMTSPGHFGYLVPPDGCNGASCLEQWIATVNPRTCYQKTGVDLNTGQKTSVANGFNVRFDIYPGGNKLGPSATYAPSINVRKGYLPNNKQSWCSANPASPYYTTLPTYSKPILNATGTTTSIGKQSARADVTNVPSADIVNAFSGAVRQCFEADHYHEQRRDRLGVRSSVDRQMGNQWVSAGCEPRKQLQHFRQRQLGLCQLLGSQPYRCRACGLHVEQPDDQPLSGLPLRDCKRARQ
jgi:hypothetical protein